eukprot:7213325-Prymnesium_polylepis.1
MQTVGVAARDELVRRHLFEANRTLWARAVEASPSSELLGVLFVLPIALLLALSLLFGRFAGLGLCAFELGGLALLTSIASYPHVQTSTSSLHGCAQ